MTLEASNIDPHDLDSFVFSVDEVIEYANDASTFAEYHSPENIFQDMNQHPAVIGPRANDLVLELPSPPNAPLTKGILPQKAIFNDPTPPVQKQEVQVVEQPMYQADISFPPHHRTVTLSGTAVRRTVMSHGQTIQHVQQVAVIPHDLTASSMASSSPIAATTNTNTTTGNFTKHDVLMGRGGMSNNHPGNKQYLRDKASLQPRYFRASKLEKTAIAQELVDLVHARGGRFMTNANGSDNEIATWTEITNMKAREKASQALREVSTPESRARKREKYSKLPPQRRQHR